MGLPRNKDIKRPLCKCGKPVTWHSMTRLGFKVWKTCCRNCENIARKYKKDKCEKCGSKKKLQVDHINADRSNNDPSNLQTLCQPCHVEKTRENKEWRRNK